MDIRRSVRRLAVVALLGAGLAGCAVYPAAVVARPGPPAIAGGHWVPGHFGPWGGWRPGHWAP